MHGEKTINLEVPLMRQKTGHDCSIACGLMMIRYYKKDIEYDDFIVKRDALGRVNIFDLATSLKKNGLNPSILFFNYSFFDDANFLSQIESITKRGIFTSIKDCISEGIPIKHKVFFTRDIEKLLISKRPVITLVSVREFRKIKMEKWRGHFIVIRGFDDKYFYYNDPHWDNKKFGKHKIEKELLMASVYRTNFPAILWVEDKP